MIYLDNAATTKICNRAVRAMEPYLNERYGNPSGIYNLAKMSKEIIEEARYTIADAINARPENIFFTSGGTESDNWVLDNVKQIGSHIITSKIEHHAILNKCEELEKEGMKVSYIQVDRTGLINPYNIEQSITKDTALISVMFANNEIGTIEPIEKIGHLARKNNILFHTDAVQAFCHIPIDVEKMNIDMLSASSHKFHGPKGVGFLYIRDPKEMNSFIFGGGQERGRRAGTENVAGIVGMGAAVKECMENLSYRMNRETELRNYLIERVLGEIPYVRLNGHSINRLPGNTNFTIAGVDGSSLVVLMDNDDICTSSASACSAGNDGPSHVIKEIGVPDKYLYGTIRMTLCADNTKEEIDYTVNRLKKNVAILRAK